VNSVLLLAAALTVSAPALKEKPKATADEPTGEWEMQSTTVSGRQSVINGQLVYAFTKEGKWVTRRDGQELATGLDRRVEFDAKAAQPTIELILNPQVATSRYQGIYKIEGDTLTICASRGKVERPTTFESPEGSGITLYVLKRVKK
jgi:uncharacterized protein (TIGR03067 family)